MIYNTLEDFISAAKDGKLDGVTVTVDNDSVYAYRYDEEEDDCVRLYDFHGFGPREVLIGVLQSMGLKAELP